MVRLTVNTPIQQGGLLSCKFYDFTPGSQVHVYVEGGGGLMSPADSQGNGGTAFYLSEKPGSYVLVAEQGSNRATASFQVTEDVSGVEPGAFRGYITSVKYAGSGSYQDWLAGAAIITGGAQIGTQLALSVSYEARASVADSQAGWQTKLEGEFNGMSAESQIQYHSGTDIGRIITMNFGLMSAGELNGEIRLYAKGIIGSWVLIAVQKIVIQGTTTGGEVPVGGENGNGGGWTLPDIPKNVGIGILVALVLAIIFIPSKPGPGRYSK